MDIDKLVFVSKCLLLDDENRVLILERSNYKNDGTQGLWDFPGGCVDLDEDVNDVIKREVIEELQIKLNDAKPFHIDSGRGDRTSQYMFVLFFSRNYEGEIKLSHEHKQFRWVSFDELENYDFYLNEKRLNAVKSFLQNV